jgi:CYTH domain-containing protein
VTFILDKQLRKRVAYSGIYWEADEFLHDVKELAEE